MPPVPKTTTAFDASIMKYPPSQRGLMAGANYRLRRYYVNGMADPVAHTAAKLNPAHRETLTALNEMTNFDGINGA